MNSLNANIDSARSPYQKTRQLYLESIKTEPLAICDLLSNELLREAYYSNDHLVKRLEPHAIMMVEILAQFLQSDGDISLLREPPFLIDGYPQLGTLDRSDLYLEFQREIFHSGSLLALKLVELILDIDDCIAELPYRLNYGHDQSLSF